MSESERRGLRLPARAAAVYLISGAIGKSAGLFLTPFFTRILPPTEYGGYAYYMSLIGFGSLFASAAHSQAVSYGGSARFGAKEFYPALFTVSVAFSLLVSLPTVLLSGLTPALGIALVFQLLADAAVGAYAMRSRYLYDYGRVATLSLFSSLAAPLLSLFLLKRGFFGGVGSRVYSLLAVSLCSAALAAVSLPVNGRLLPRRDELSYALKTALPFLPGALAAALSTEADKLIVARILGSGALAKYSVAYSIGAGLYFVSTALSSALCPWLTRRVERGELEKAVAPVRAVVTLLFSASVAVILIAPEALGILAPRSYASALYAVLPVALCVPLSFLLGLSTLLLTQRGAARRAALLSAIGGLSGALLSLPLTKLFGLTGAATAGFAGTFISLYLSLLALGGVGASSPLSLGELLYTLFPFLPLALISALLYPYPRVRLLLLAFVLFLALRAIKSTFPLLFRKEKSPPI